MPAAVRSAPRRISMPRAIGRLAAAGLAALAATGAARGDDVGHAAPPPPAFGAAFWKHWGDGWIARRGVIRNG